MSELKDLQARALQIAQQYAELNVKQGHNQWGPKDRAMGFAVDVGELLELVMAKEGMRSAEDVDTKLRHELTDCLWSLLVLASHYKIDLSAEFTTAMDKLEQRIKDAT